MSIVLVTVASLLVPGFGAAFIGQWRAAAAWTGALALTLIASAFSIWLLPLAIALMLGNAIDSARRARTAQHLGMPSTWGTAAIHAALSLIVFSGVRSYVVAAFRVPTSSMVPTLQVGDHVWLDRIAPLWRGVSPGDVIAFRDPCTPGIEYIKRVVATAGQRVELRCDVLYIDGKPVPTRPSSGACSYDDFDDFVPVPAWYARACSDYVETLGAHTYHVTYDAERPDRDAEKSTRVGHAPFDFPQLDGSGPPSCATADGWVSPAHATHHVNPWFTGDACDPQAAFTVPHNHVFVLGDNRVNSKDSRMFGPVPLSKVVAVVRGIWASHGRAGIGLRRFSSVP